MKHAGLFRTALAAGLLLTPAAAPAATPAGMTAFADAVASLNDYSATVTVHETEGGRLQDRVYHFLFKKPNLAKSEIVSGPGKGSGAVWHGGDTVRGHQGGLLAGIKLNVNIHDGRATSLRGDTIDSGAFWSELEHFKTTKGELSESAGPSINGVATDALILTVADPVGNHDVTREILFLSKATHLPVRRQRYQGELVVKQEDFTSVRINPGLKDDDFNL